ncbi:enoyl-CoA hydratase/isomerase family protein [Acuticoccus sediminis]|uniref:enoyl-CoA hydratase/isomerase family protein n=1 Tax=Acuticoccus sediminis TaxID=2184697 RepID=UPI001CFD67FE|nr:enoyl-CoA hydratase/isomerase family protein [Acuticoccus sediminis]
MTDDAPITVAREAGVAVVTLNRPQTRNAFTPELTEAFAEVFPALRDDASLSAVVLTAASGTFSAGGDMRLLAEPSTDVRRHAAAGETMHAWFRAYLDIPVPVIAAVDGPAFGGGFGLALGADFLLASERARFCTVFPRIGLVAGLGTAWLLPRIVGLAAARDLLLTGRIIGAGEALAMGLVREVVAGDALGERALRMAGHFRHASRGALAGTKELLRQAAGAPFDAAAAREIDLQARALASPDHHAAARELLQTRRVAFDWGRLEEETGKE